ncbi:peptidase M23 [Amycolatopsis antarctica]|uniref:Peptidase M23 n=1 Tax=Amycolatopsis antarctica TaxID=1854586 RepID=A0A263D9M7_9PSEU|nr:M23 family metallopeptidase [Amycolatopsis antarctica]OZM75232.1 peptidase M23 [Amycolatopsis antarctica]
MKLGKSKLGRSTVVLGIAAAAFGVVPGVGEAGQAAAAPDFQMPFKCDYTATAATYSGHSPENGVDFQKANIDNEAVLASAAGTVSVVGNEGDDSYGKWVELDHGGGYTTRYAHLSSQQVKDGQKVDLGTQLGTVGSTGGSSGPHLHYEQRQGGTTLKAKLAGKAVPYFDKTEFTSKNRCGGGGNPHTPEKVCGDGYSVINKHALGKEGTVYLLYNAGDSKNCVTTLKNTSLGKESPVSASLEVQGGEAATDAGDFGYYAGPVSKDAAGKCVKWGGSAGKEKFTSPFEHCG